MYACEYLYGARRKRSHAHTHTHTLERGTGGDRDTRPDRVGAIDDRVRGHEPECHANPRQVSAPARARERATDRERDQETVFRVQGLGFRV